MCKYPINNKWFIYYQILEYARKAGVTNGRDADVYLAEYCNIDIVLAKDILCSWIDNYDELNKKCSWNQLSKFEGNYEED